MGAALSVHLRVMPVLYKYSVTSPYGHLSIMDSLKYQKSYIPYHLNTDTSIKRTLGSVPLVSISKRLDCNLNFDIALSIKSFIPVVTSF